VPVADVRVRQAVNADASVLGDLFRKSSLSNAGDRASLIAHPDALEFSGEALKEHRVRVAIVDDRIVGFATVVATGRVGELEDLFVDPDWMRCGVGRALVVDAIDKARDQGLSRINVMANEHALVFYKNVGFVYDGTSRLRFGTGHRMHIDVPSRPERGRLRGHC
jgi:GNAT superfamily N-acetyltransferase